METLTFYEDTLYATGKFQATPSTTLLSGLSVPTGKVGIFNAKFSTSGSPVANSFMEPIDIGMNEGTDIAAMDTSLITTGYLVPTSTQYTFGNETLIPNSLISDAFIARVHFDDVLYFRPTPEEITESEELIAAEMSTERGISIFPNPNDGKFTLVSNGDFTGQLSIYSSTGQLIISRYLIEAGSIEEELALMPGVYFIIINGDEKQERLSFIVQ